MPSIKQNEIFHDVTLGGVRFVGIMSADGPFLQAWRGGYLEAGVALGVSSVAFVGENLSLVKYRKQERLRLDQFAPRDVERLCVEFGLSWPAGNKSFYDSPAYAGLVRWVEKHPRLAKAYSVKDDYLPGWYRNASSDAKEFGDAATATLGLV